MAVVFDAKAKLLDVEKEIRTTKELRKGLEVQLTTADTDIMMRTILSERLKVYDEEIKRLETRQDTLLDNILA